VFVCFIFISWCLPSDLMVFEGFGWVEPPPYPDIRCYCEGWSSGMSSDLV